MSRTAYPRIHSTLDYSQGQSEQRIKPCAVCGARAAGFVVIQWNHMRGDDERYDVCGRHHDMARGRDTDRATFLARLVDALNLDAEMEELQ